MAGEKLSKQTLAEPISTWPPGQLIFDALSFLGQNPPAEIKHAPLNDIWCWAHASWSTEMVPKERKIIVYS